MVRYRTVYKGRTTLKVKLRTPRIFWTEVESYEKYFNEEKPLTQD